MSDSNDLNCDTCFTSNKNVPIIEKPTRFGYKGRVIYLEIQNFDNRPIDNTCLDCLEEETLRAKTDWF